MGGQVLSYIKNTSLETHLQEHFYLETQQVVVIPHEDDELEIVASTQGVTDVQVRVWK